MVVLGHQFRGGSDSDWMTITSIRHDIRGNTKKILQEIFKENNAGESEKTPKKYKSPPSSSNSSKNHCSSRPTNNVKDSNVSDCGTDESEKDRNVNSSRAKNSSGYIFENFDESQHLNGCPLKWLYYKKLSERNSAYLVRRSCSKKSVKREEIKRHNSNANVRDKTPIEVKIHKINLMERSDMNYCKQSSIDEPDIRREIDIHRRNLAAKLNWKLHSDTQDDSEMEVSSQLRYNYLHPRPLWGLKPLLSILLLPHQETSCCPSKIQIQPSSTKDKPMESPSLSIKSLELPLVKAKEKSSASRVNSHGRWGSKSHRSEKKLQVPNQITINLRRKHVKGKPETGNKVTVGNGLMKKSKEQTKPAPEAKSLSSLFYKLSNKMNYKNENNEYFEDLLRDLTVEDEQFKLQRFFQHGVAKRNSGTRGPKGKTSDEKQTKRILPSGGKSENRNFKCGRASFFERLTESKNRK